MIRHARRALIVLAAAIGAACSDTNGTGQGSLSLKLTDAPGDFEKAVVTISQIYLQPGENSDAQRVVLREEDVTVDLLTLANSTADLVEDATVPAGTYTQLRFIVTGAYIEVENADGTTSIYASSQNYEGLPAGAQVDGTLQMPSFAQTGIKVNLPGGAVEIGDEARVLVVDFDVSRSFGRQAGASGMWVMSPVLDATEFGTTGTQTVTLTKASDVTMPTVNGQVLTLGQFHAVLSTSAGSEEKIQLTDSDNNGTFEAQFRFLAPGTYTVDFEAPEGVSFTTNPTRPATVTVASGGSATQAFTLTAATSP